jgi:alkylation response protein AidB-like acyl-CoA dehydrogenase
VLLPVRARGQFRCYFSKKTTAIDKGDHYLLNGTKNWITNGSSASTYIIAQTDIEGHKGINL